MMQAWKCIERRLLSSVTEEKQKGTRSGRSSASESAESVRAVACAEAVGGEAVRW